MAKDKKTSGGIRAQEQQRTWFDKLSSMKKDVLCVAILYALILLVFGKIVFNNMIFTDEGDILAHQAWVQAIDHIRETEHVDPLWIPYAFSGMPVFATLIFPHDNNYVDLIINLMGKVLFFGCDLSWFIMHYLVIGLFMYWLARVLKFSHLPSLLAALTFMLNPYSIGLAQTGHGSKLITLSYIPLLFLCAYYLFQKRSVLWFALLSIITGTIFLCRHPQIAFYGMLVIGCYLVYEMVFDIKQKQLSSAVKKALLFAAAVGIGFAIYSYEFFPVNEYANYSIRGGSETGVSKGLDYDYATNWSFHPFETLTYIVPSFFGFSSSYVADWQGQERALPLYWGWMPFTDTPVYIGIIPLLLGIIALIYNRDRLSWFLGIFSLLVLFLSFGRYFNVVYLLFFNYFPYFNKLRVPPLILYLIPFTFGLLAANGTNFLMDLFTKGKEIDTAQLKKRLTTMAMILVGTIVIGFIGKSALYSFLSDFMFVKEGDVRQYGQEIVKIFKEKRFDLLWSYYVGFSVMTALFCGLIIAYLNRKVQATMMVFGFIALLVVDLYLIDVKYVNPIHNNAIQERFLPDPTTQRLQDESDTSRFRIMATGSLFMDNTYMYHHLEMANGYSPAKLKIYQDVIDSCISRGNRNVINMLNVKYLVGQAKAQDGSVQTVAQPNPEYLPRAWFVDSAVVARSKTQVFAYMNAADWNPQRTAILEKGLPSALALSGSASVKIASYSSREITFSAATSNPSLLVVSEVYYPAGWKAFIDGTETEIYKTNYILRSVLVPGGSHTIVFRFEPTSYATWYTVSQISWGAGGLLLFVGLLLNPKVKEKIGLKKRTPAETETVSQQ